MGIEEFLRIQYLHPPNQRIMEAELIEEKTIPKGTYDGLILSKEDFLT